jgi:hypothetical protein
MPLPLALIPAGAKGIGVGVKAITKLSNFATNVLSQKRDKAKVKLDEQKTRLAQLEALAGGTTGSAQRPESLTTALAFGNTFKAEKGVSNKLSELKKGEKNFFKTDNESGNKMEKVKEFASKYWMYLVGAVVVFMFLKRKRR